VGVETLLSTGIPCRLCGSSSTKNLGKIPDCGEFAGQSITPSINGGYLMHCLDCDSLFRSPILSQAEYMDLYQNAPDTLWKSYQEIRNDFIIIRDLLSNMAGGKILDIGCHSGLFLRSLPARFEKFGIEPSNSASLVAQSQGVNILGKTLTQINPDRQFDIVVAIDVIEHVTDVNEFIRNALRHVKENGLFIISTGNPDYLLWKKIFKGKFWYNSFSEHLTFPSIEYFACYCKQVGLTNPLQFRFSYLKCSFGWKLMLCISQIIFFISPAIFRFSERILRKIIGKADRLNHEFGLSAGGLFRDHHLIVIKNEKDGDPQKEQKMSRIGMSE
jgi:SAM-dependent methyltransferase